MGKLETECSDKSMKKTLKRRLSQDESSEVPKKTKKNKKHSNSPGREIKKSNDDSSVKKKLPSWLEVSDSEDDISENENKKKIDKKKKEKNKLKKEIDSDDEEAKRLENYFKHLDDDDEENNLEDNSQIENKINIGEVEKSEEIIKKKKKKGDFWESSFEEDTIQKEISPNNEEKVVSPKKLKKKEKNKFLMNSTEIESPRPIKDIKKKKKDTLNVGNESILETPELEKPKKMKKKSIVDLNISAIGYVTSDEVDNSKKIKKEKLPKKVGANSPKKIINLEEKKLKSPEKKRRSVFTDSEKSEDEEEEDGIFTKTKLISKSKESKTLQTQIKNNQSLNDENDIPIFSQKIQETQGKNKLNVKNPIVKSQSKKKTTKKNDASDNSDEEVLKNLRMLEAKRESISKSTNQQKLKSNSCDERSPKKVENQLDSSLKFSLENNDSDDSSSSDSETNKSFKKSPRIVNDSQISPKKISKKDKTDDVISSHSDHEKNVKKKITNKSKSSPKIISKNEKVKDSSLSKSENEKEKSKGNLKIINKSINSPKFLSKNQSDDDDESSDSENEEIVKKIIPINKISTSSQKIPVKKDEFDDTSSSDSENEKITKTNIPINENLKKNSKISSTNDKLEETSSSSSDSENEKKSEEKISINDRPMNSEKIPVKKDDFDDTSSSDSESEKNTEKKIPINDSKNNLEKSVKNENNDDDDDSSDENDPSPFNKSMIMEVEIGDRKKISLKNEDDDETMDSETIKSPAKNLSITKNLQKASKTTLRNDENDSTPLSDSGKKKNAKKTIQTLKSPKKNKRVDNMSSSDTEDEEIHTKNMLQKPKHKPTTPRKNIEEKKQKKSTISLTKKSSDSDELVKNDDSEIDDSELEKNLLELQAKSKKKSKTSAKISESIINNLSDTKDEIKEQTTLRKVLKKTGKVKKTFVDMATQTIESSFDHSKNKLNDENLECTISETQQDKSSKKRKKKISEVEKNEKESSSPKKIKKKATTPIKVHVLPKQQESDEDDIPCDVKKPKKISDEDAMILREIKIKLTHKVLPQHKIEKRAGGAAPTPEEREEFEKITKITKGMFNSHEDNLIVRNWHDFCLLHGWDETLVEPFLKWRHNGAYYIPSLQERKKFVQFLAKDLNDRSLHSVFHRFIVLYSDNKTSRYTDEEDQYILGFMRKHPDVTPADKFARIGAKLKRTNASVWRRYKILQNNKEETPTKKKRMTKATIRKEQGKLDLTENNASRIIESPEREMDDSSD